MIPDHLYKPAMEGTVFTQQFTVEGDFRRALIFKDAIPAFDKPDDEMVPQLKFLEKLQGYHDDENRWENDRQTNPNAMQDYVKEMVETNG